MARGRGSGNEREVRETDSLGVTTSVIHPPSRKSDFIRSLPIALYPRYGHGSSVGIHTLGQKASVLGSSYSRSASSRPFHEHCLCRQQSLCWFAYVMVEVGWHW